MNYDKALTASIKDLSTFSDSDLAALATYYDVKIDNELYKNLATHILQHKLAHFDGDSEEEPEEESEEETFPYKRTPIDDFVDAVADGNLKVAKEILNSKSIDPNAVVGYSKTPLLVAVMPNVDAVKMLLEAGAKPDQRDKDRMTPLIRAIRHGNLELVKILLETGKADPGAYSNQGWTALMATIDHAVLEGKPVYLEILKELLKPQYIDQLAVGEGNELDSRSPLQIAVQDGDPLDQLKVIDILLATGRANPSYQDDNDWTALIYAAQSGRVEVAKKILATGESDINVAGKEGFTALLIAADYGYDGMVDLLLENDADPSVKNKYDMTALMYTVQSGHEGAVRKILATGESGVNATNDDGNTALLIAADAGDGGMVDLLLEYGADPSVKNKKGFTALMYAVDNVSIDMVNNLLKTEKANINAQNNQGETALLRAARFELLDIVQALINAGARVTIKDNNGQSALQIVAKKKEKSKGGPGFERFVKVEQALAEATIKELLTTKPGKELAKPKEAPYWMYFCATLTDYGMKTLQRLATELDIPTEGKNKRQLCAELTKNYEELMSATEEKPGTYEHPLAKKCKNDSTLLGEEWEEIKPDDFFITENKVCFSFDDITSIMEHDQLDPFSRRPLQDIKLRDGGSLLDAYNIRKASRQIAIDEERLKKMRQIHTIITNPVQKLKNELAELIDTHPGGPGQRNYFDVNTLDEWEQKTGVDYAKFLGALRNEELVENNDAVLETLKKFKIVNYVEFLEALIRSIKAMPEENKQTYRLLLKIKLEGDEGEESEESA